MTNEQKLEALAIDGKKRALRKMESYAGDEEIVALWQSSFDFWHKMLLESRAQ
tara:strand:+ start:198 stop:356 length:159 start_codon:yes stop_codon:yes gene_type:complete